MKRNLMLFFVLTVIMTAVFSGMAFASDSVYDGAWTDNDRITFASLLVQADRDTIYADYVRLANELNRIDKSAYRGEMGYILFSPQLTEELNHVWQATTARSLLLRDIAQGHSIKNIDSYYPAGGYKFFYKPVKKAGEYSYCDLNELAWELNMMPIPNYYLYGNRIYNINGYTEGAAGLNSGNSTKGFFDDYIMLFHANSLEGLVGTMYHEVGHNVAHEINRSHTNGLGDYAAIYGKSTGGASWGDRENENFAEDFALLYGGSEKRSNWKEDHSAEVDTFIQSKINSVNYRVPLIKGTTITTKDVQIPLIPLGYKCSKQDYLVSGRRLTLNFEGLITNGYTLGVAVDGTDYHEVYRLNGNQCEIVLPEKNCLFTVRAGILSTETVGTHEFWGPLEIEPITIERVDNSLCEFDVLCF